MTRKKKPPVRTDAIWKETDKPFSVQLVESGEVGTQPKGQNVFILVKPEWEQGILQGAHRKYWETALKEKATLSSQMRKGKWLQFKEIENSLTCTNTTNNAGAASWVPIHKGVPRNMKIRGFQKQKATRLEFQKLVILEFIRPPCPRLLWAKEKSCQF